MSADVDGARASQARVVAELTRQALVMLQNVERGLLPVRVLGKVCDPRLIAALGPIPPPKPAELRAPRRVGRIRVHLVNDRLAHVAAVATRPDGRPSGYVLELHRPHGDRRWRIAELSRVEQRRILGPERQIPGEPEPAAPTRLPADLTGLIGTVKQEQTRAVAALEQAHAKLRDVRDKLGGAKAHGSDRQRRHRATLRDQERTAARNIARWQRAVGDLNAELEHLLDVHDLREVRQAVLDGDPLMRARAPVYLDQLLGPVPHDRDQRAGWRKAASRIEGYRQRWNVTEREALGTLPADAPAEQVADRQAAAEASHTYRNRQRALQRDVSQDAAIELEP